MNLLQAIKTCNRLGSKSPELIETASGVRMSEDAQAEMREYGRARDRVPKWLYKLIF